MVDRYFEPMFEVKLLQDEYAYGPNTEVAKRFFFESEVLDATLMMGWSGVGWGMLTFV